MTMIGQRPARSASQPPSSAATIPTPLTTTVVAKAGVLGRLFGPGRARGRVAALQDVRQLAPTVEKYPQSGSWPTFPVGDVDPAMLERVVRVTPVLA